MRPQMFEKSSHLQLPRRHQQGVPLLQVLGKLQQISLIRLARQRTQPLFHAQIDQILANQLGIAVRTHTLIISAGQSVQQAKMLPESSSPTLHIPHRAKSSFIPDNKELRSNT